ncbi:MAG: MBL fold metallo-hydrolase [Bacteroidetes bacterium]|nr:MBL fold metallo-hydrolase [Bacteroidota bacterium]
MSLKNFLTGGFTQEQFDAVEIQIHDAAPGILMLTGEGGNIGVSYGEDATFMVDTQFAPLTDKLLSAIATRTAHPIAYVLNSHWHADHVGGNANLMKHGATIIAHTNVRKRLGTDQFLESLGVRVPACHSEALPSSTFTDKISFYLNGEEIEIFHAVNAHTDGDAIVHFVQGNVIQMGDTYFNGMYPLIDVDTGGSIDGMIAVADEVLSRSDNNTKIIPGHGPLSNHLELQASRDMLLTVRDAVASLMDQGMDQQQIIAAKPTSDIDADWEGGVLEPDVFVEHVFTSLSQSVVE